MQKAREMLLEAGLRAEQINIKVIGGSRNAASDFLKKAKNVDAGTIFLASTVIPV